MAEQDDLARARWQQFTREAAAVMDEERPDRYVVQDTTEDALEDVEADSEGVEWMDRAAERVADLVPESQLRRTRIARQKIGRIETANLRRGNKHLRDLAETGQLSLECIPELSYPISVTHRVVEQGKRPRVRVERVRLGAAMSTDLRLFAQHELRQAAEDFATRQRTCEAAVWLADELDSKGLKTLDDWQDARSEQAAVH